MEYTKFLTLVLLLFVSTGVAYSQDSICGKMIFKIKIALILLLLYGYTNYSLAQKQQSSCATQSLSLEEAIKQPWFGNNQFLYDFLDKKTPYEKTLLASF